MPRATTRAAETIDGIPLRASTLEKELPSIFLVSALYRAAPCAGEMGKFEASNFLIYISQGRIFKEISFNFILHLANKGNDAYRN